MSGFEFASVKRAGMAKKRKSEVDLDAERTLYSSFVSAANAVSQLYTQASQQQRRAAATASRQTLERIICFVLKESAENSTLNSSALLQYLQQEYESVDTCEHPSQHNPVYQLLPVPSHGVSVPSALDGGNQDCNLKHPRAGNLSGAFTSPSRRGTTEMETTETERHVMECSLPNCSVLPSENHNQQPQVLAAPPQPDAKGFAALGQLYGLTYQRTFGPF